MDSSRAIDFSKIENQLASDDYESAIQLIEENLKSDNLRIEDKIELLNFYANAQNYSGEIDRARVTVEELFNLIISMKSDHDKDFKTTFLELKANISMASILRQLGMEAEAIDYITRGEKDLEYIKHSLQTYSSQVAKEESMLLRIKGIIYWTKGDLDNALQQYEKSLEIDEMYDDKRAIASTLNNIGIVYLDKGKYNQSLEYHNKSLKMRQILGQKKGIADSLNNIGIIYKDRGELDHSLDYFLKSLDIYKELHLDHYIAHTLGNIGTLHRIRRNFFQAQKYLEQSLKLYHKTNSRQFIALVLEELVQLQLLMDNQEKAKSHIDQLLRLKENNPGDHVIKIHYNISLGLYYKFSGSFSDIVKAEEIFREIVNGEIINYNKTLLATENLIEILLYEYKSVDQENLLKEVHTLLISIQEIAKDQRLFPTMIHALCVRAKLAMIEGDYIESRLLLQQALLNAEEFGLPLLIDEIQVLIERIDYDLKKYKAILEKNALIVEKLNQSDLVEYLTRLQQSLT